MTLRIGRLILLLALALTAGCNVMPEEDPGYHVRRSAAPSRHARRAATSLQPCSHSVRPS